LGKIGCPIRGDVKYGAKKINEDGRIHLHSAALEFIHPVQNTEVCIKAPIPDEQIWRLFRQALGEIEFYKDLV
jgi:23S rRNA pseudouridine1911/1915/1917 synthase